jgi:hypothetical protein
LVSAVTAAFSDSFSRPVASPAPSSVSAINQRAPVDYTSATTSAQRRISSRAGRPEVEHPRG